MKAYEPRFVASLWTVNGPEVLPNVHRYEIEADRFAVAQVGKESMIEFLEHLRQTRPTGPEVDSGAIGAKELAIHIELIRKHSHQRE
jgi:hypothetical protein